MLSKTLVIVALSATAAVASPHMAHSHFHNRGTGTGGGFAMPTGGPFDRNGTDSVTVGHSTVEQTAAVSSAPVAFAGVAAVSDTEVAPVVDSTTTTCISTSTLYATSMEYITVTATSGNPGSDILFLQTTSVPSTIAAATAGLSTTGTLNAGEFFGVGSYTKSWASASSAVSSVVSAVSSAVQTTFATMASTSKAVSVTTTTAAASSATSASTSSTRAVSGSKKGISYNTASLVSAFTDVSWAYNWAATADGSPGVEFVPMLWGLNFVSAWASDAAAAVSAGATAVLSFNEPDLAAQSNIDPATAATQHIAAMKNFVGKVEIGSPAITNGAGTSPLMGIDWLSEFFTSCGPSCPVDFVAFHWYDDAANFAYFQQHVNDVITTAKANGVDKVWLTEFGATGSLADQATFLAQAIPFLESTAAVERYAYFMASEGTLLTGGALNVAGEAYVS